MLITGIQMTSIFRKSRPRTSDPNESSKTNRDSHPYPRDLKMDRRTFLGLFSVSAIASSLPVALVACSNTSKPSADRAIRADGFAKIGTVSQLTQAGKIADAQSAVGPVIAVRTPQKTAAAVNSTCTHKGCTVSWRDKEQDFLCPCHGARFGMDGTVLEGPAKQPLATYETKIERDLVLVKVPGTDNPGTPLPPPPTPTPNPTKDSDRDSQKKQ